MKHVTCDICGKEISLEDRMRAEKTSTIMKVIGVDIDICPGCRLIGLGLDPSAVLLSAWKNEVKKAG